MDIIIENFNKIFQKSLETTNENSSNVSTLNGATNVIVEDILPSQSEQIQTTNDTLDMILTEVLPELMGE